MEQENQVTAEQTVETAGMEQDKAETSSEPSQQGIQMEDIKKLIQSEVDKVRTKYVQEKTALQKELEQLKREKLTDDERRELELADKEKAIAEREQSLLDKENRLYTIKAMKAAGLDDGSDTSLGLVDFLLGDTQEEIDSRVKVFSEILNKLVSAKVESTFKSNGRTPNGATSSTKADSTELGHQVAVHLGKIRAEKETKSQEILNQYIGGN